MQKSNVCYGFYFIYYLFSIRSSLRTPLSRAEVRSIPLSGAHNQTSNFGSNFLDVVYFTLADVELMLEV